MRSTARLEISLLVDAKEQAEHAMLVDLARNDLARVCRPGSRRIEGPMSVEKYGRVQHIVTQVVGELATELDALDAYRACANMGTLTGAPKLRAVELIRGIEASPRGFYGGALGYVSASGRLSTCIVIRALRQREGRYELRSGAGIVADSSPERELAETLSKIASPLEALSAAEASA